MVSLNKIYSLISLCVIFFYSCKENDSKTEVQEQSHITGNHDLNKLKDQLLNADSVWIVSHEMYFQYENDTLRKQYDEPSQVFADSGLHCSIIKEKKLIKGTALTDLISIITRPAKNTDTVFATCCVPAHAILIIRKGEISYIDFCLDCHGFISSPGIHFSSDNFDSTKWSELRNFVKRMGIRYEI